MSRGLMFDRSAIKSRTDLPHISWMSVQGRPIEPAGKYEKACKAKGVSPDPAKLAELIGGERVHLRSHTLDNGLRFGTIHNDDGTQIRDIKEYGGLFSCNCGAMHDAPCVATARVLNNVDLGDGFLLKLMMASYDGTSTSVEKQFVTGNRKDKLEYSVDESGNGEINLTSMTYELRVANFFGEFRYFSDNTSKLTVALDLSNPEYTADFVYDQVVFNFDNTGILIRVAALSQTDQPNPSWAESVLTAIKKGQHEWAIYAGDSLEAKTLCEGVLGIDLSRSFLNIRKTIDGIVDAAVNGIFKTIERIPVFSPVDN